MIRRWHLFLALILILMFVSIVHCWNLYRASRHLPHWRPFIDLAIGFNVMYFACALFQGHIVLRATSWAVWLLMIGSMSAVMLQSYREGTIEEYEDTPDDYELLEEESEDYEMDAELGYESA